MKRIGCSFLLVASFFAISASAQNADPAPQRPAVLVLPFELLESDNRYNWIGRGIQQNLQAELGRSGGIDIVGEIAIVRPGLPDGAAAQTSDAEALQLARDADATTVVYGSYQLVHPNVRITGKVVDVGTGKVLNFLKANGTVTEILSLEDVIADQALDGLTGVATTNATVSPAAPRQEVIATQRIATPDPAGGTLPYDDMVADTAAYEGESKIPYRDRDDDDDAYVRDDWSPYYSTPAYVYTPVYYPSGYYSIVHPYYYGPAYYYDPFYYPYYSTGFFFTYGYYSYPYYRQYGHHHHHHHHHGFIDRREYRHDDDHHRGPRFREESPRGEGRPRGVRPGDGGRRDNNRIEDRAPGRKPLPLAYRDAGPRRPVRPTADRAPVRVAADSQSRGERDRDSTVVRAPGVRQPQPARNNPPARSDSGIREQQEARGNNRDTRTITRQPVLASASRRDRDNGGDRSIPVPGVRESRASGSASAGSRGSSVASRPDRVREDAGSRGGREAPDRGPVVRERSRSVDVDSRTSRAPAPREATRAPSRAEAPGRDSVRSAPSRSESFRSSSNRGQASPARGESSSRGPAEFRSAPSARSFEGPSRSAAPARSMDAPRSSGAVRSSAGPRASSSSSSGDGFGGGRGGGGGRGR